MPEPKTGHPAVRPDPVPCGNTIIPSFVISLAEIERVTNAVPPPRRKVGEILLELVEAGVRVEVSSADRNAIGSAICACGFNPIRLGALWYPDDNPTENTEAKRAREHREALAAKAQAAQANDHPGY